MIVTPCPGCGQIPCICGRQGYLTLYLPLEHTRPGMYGLGRVSTISPERFERLKIHTGNAMRKWLQREYLGFPGTGTYRRQEDDSIMPIPECPKCWGTPCTCGHNGYITVYLPPKYTEPDPDSGIPRPTLTRKQLDDLETFLKSAAEHWLINHA